MAVSVDVCYNELNGRKVLQYFESEVNACALPACNPKGGEVYFFGSEDDLKKGE